eukprot:CAMPEP_0197393850 /NCGR_PEP_ID=MMETSP1165-20131217/4551_1 /TAXON_ID=284809 /ORGANISM="Chrysocystis fragilis, Strain CCMP3189" /LENGTH=448 /DNA_ID=CAMNT_0042919527 /DNA_START=44 /DNA_END=1390 /DNA_ORIENTATION=+
MMRALGLWVALGACEELSRVGLLEASEEYYYQGWVEASQCGGGSSVLFAGESLDEAALAVAREFVADETCATSYELLEEADAYGAFRAAAAAAAGVEKATALAIVLLVIEHGAAPFDDPEVVSLCRSLDRASRDSLVSSLEDYFGDFYDSAALELGSLRYALLHEDDDSLEEDVELWIDVAFFMCVFGVACGLSAVLRNFYRLAASAGVAATSVAKQPRRRAKPRKKKPLVAASGEDESVSEEAAADSEEEEESEEEPPRRASFEEEDSSSREENSASAYSQRRPPRTARAPKRPAKLPEKPPRRRRHHPGSQTLGLPPRAPSPSAAPPQQQKPSLSSKVDRRSFAEALSATKPPPEQPVVAASVKVVPLPPEIGDAQLRARFARYGGVVGARVFGDADPPHGYVDFERRADAVAAAFDAHGRSLFSLDTDNRVACIVRERFEPFVVK